MILIQLFIPTQDNDGNAFPKETHEQIKLECLEKFGGVTGFTQSLAEGLWDEGDKVQADRIVIYEIITDEIEKPWWYVYQEKLERRLNQEKILIRWSEIEIL